jgi:hypothetical protein
MPNEDNEQEEQLLGRDKVELENDEEVDGVAKSSSVPLAVASFHMIHDDSNCLSPVPTSPFSSLSPPQPSFAEAAVVVVQDALSQKPSSTAQPQRDIWDCPVCTFLNKGSARACTMCDTKNPSARPNRISARGLLKQQVLPGR